MNRVGVDESMTFWGGSEVIGPSGEPIFSAPFFDDDLYLVDVNLDDVRRERIALPLLRDERLELQARELGRIIAERAGWPPTRPRSRGAGAGAGRRAGAAPCRAPARLTARRCTRARRPDRAEPIRLRSRRR